MKTINIEPHSLTLERHVVSSKFVLIFNGTTPGGQPVRLRVLLSGAPWVEDIARELHTYLQAEQNKINEAKKALRGE